MTDKNDRRVSRVAMTDEGMKLIKSINYQASNEFVHNALTDIDENITDNLFSGLEQLYRKLEEKKGDFND